MYALGRVSVRMVTVDSEFDLERYYDDDVSTRVARGSLAIPRNSHVGYSQGVNEKTYNSQDPFDDSFEIGAAAEDVKQSPPDNLQDALPDEVQPVKPEVDEPYHIFNKREKWFLIAIIGVAGMFSGLSSNIYFPSLDAIARVSPPSLTINYPTHKDLAD
jgi:hypothetical protein